MLKKIVLCVLFFGIFTANAIHSKKRSSENFDISVVVLIQEEGFRVFHTLKSIKLSIKEAQNAGINSEVICLITKTDEQTNAYLKKASSQFKNLSIVYSNSVDQWKCKTLAAQTARGKYITFIKGDNLMSQSWLAKAFQLARSTANPVIIHPKYEIGLDKNHEIVVNSNDSNLANFALFSGNAYSSFYMMDRKLFLQIESETDNFPQYRDYDWAFNCRVSNSGIKHICAEETAWFVRRPPEPLSCGLESDKAINSFLRKRKCILDRKSFPNFKVTHPDFSYTKAFITAILSQPMSMLSEELRPAIIQFQLNQLYFNQINKHVPKWLINEIIYINKNVYPLIRSIHYRQAKISSQISRNCNFLISSFLMKLQNLKQVYSCVVFKFVGIGGSEKMAKLYADTMAQDGSIFKITTADKNPIANDDVFNFYVVTEKMFTYDQKLQLFTQILEKIQPAKIYFNNSKICKNALSSFGPLISSFSDIFFGAFCVYRLPKTKEFILSDADEEIYPYLKQIITDNKSYVDQLTKTFPFYENKVIHNYMPMKCEKFTPKFQENNQLNIFWAGRICREKRPDILLKIIDACKDLPIKFHVFGELGKYYRSETHSQLSHRENVICYGKYSSFSDIVDPNFDLLLYTSETDGMPNVILEAMSFGYPVIAPDIGGITEVVTPETSFVIPNCEDSDAYVKILKSLINNKQPLRNKQKYIRKILKTKFNEKNFINTLEKIGLKQKSIQDEQ